MTFLSLTIPTYQVSSWLFWIFVSDQFAISLLGLSILKRSQCSHGVLFTFLSKNFEATAPSADLHLSLMNHRLHFLPISRFLYSYYSLPQTMSHHQVPISEFANYLDFRSSDSSSESSKYCAYIFLICTQSVLPLLSFLSLAANSLLSKTEYPSIHPFFAFAAVDSGLYIKTLSPWYNFSNLISRFQESTLKSVSLAHSLSNLWILTIEAFKSIPCDKASKVLLSFSRSLGISKQ